MNPPTSDLMVPASRVEPLRRITERLLASRLVVLTTHHNADGDGAGSQAALAAWLEARGVRVAIVNPTPFPESLSFMLHRPALVADFGTEAGEQALRAADLFAVLDTSEAQRIRPLAERMPPERTVVIDHHPPGPSVVGSLALQDPSAAATGELIYDLITLSGTEWPSASVLGTYVALVSDTGSFRHSNTTPRVHRIAAELMERGVNADAVYRRLFGSLPLRRVELLREALATLRSEGGISWLMVSDELVRRLDATPEDLDGLIEHARALEGTEVALLFRETPDGGTKMSFRSNGDVDVNRIARRFGGGGHVKASGATTSTPPSEAIPTVLGAVRDAVEQLGNEARL